MPEIRFAADDPCTYRFGHDDPDNSGQCIHCGAIIDVMRSDLDHAIAEGREPKTFPQAVSYVESMERLRARRGSHA